MLKKYIFPSIELLSVGFAEELYTKILQFSSGQINIALSGGNTPKFLFKYLAEHYSTKIEWKRIHFFWVDERCVPPDHQESNFGMTKKSLLDYISIPIENIHRIKGEEHPAVETRRYAEEAIANVKLKNNLPSFDIIIMGIGEDGHTASIFPDQMYLLNSAHIYAPSIHPSTKQSRITMTGKLINNSEHVYFLVSGKSKAKIVRSIFNEEPEADLYPANYIMPLTKNLYWYLDSDAAEEL